MGIQDIIEGKKQWRAHMARVKALPPDYTYAGVYQESAGGKTGTAGE